MSKKLKLFIILFGISILCIFAIFLNNEHQKKQRESKSQKIFNEFRINYDKVMHGIVSEIDDVDNLYESVESAYTFSDNVEYEILDDILKRYEEDGMNYVEYTYMLDKIDELELVFNSKIRWNKMTDDEKSEIDLILRRFIMRVDYKKE